MIELSRHVRFFLNGPSAGPDAVVAKAVNGFSAWPAARGLARFYQLQVCCKGEVNPQTGYFVNIKQIDQAVRDHVLPFLEQTLADEKSCGQLPMGRLMQKMLALLGPPLDDSVESIVLELSPFHTLAMQRQAMNHVIIRQQFEFAAAHRLHVDSLSAGENQRVFGKCNNPSGHGHNYKLEVAVSAPIDPQGHILLVEALDDRVDQHIIQKLDHKHLNIDVPQFASLNPSCENIAMVAYDMLKDQLGDLGVKLDAISVWETSKTACTYRGEA